MSRTRKQSGKLSRNKGKEFERWLAAQLRAELGEPAVESAGDVRDSRVRRGEQGHGAVHADVYVVDLPFWFECQHAARPDAEAKLLQARADVERSGRRHVPVAVVRRSGARGRRQVEAAMFLSDLIGQVGFVVPQPTTEMQLLGQSVVTFDFRVLLSIVRRAEGARRRG